uniref:Zinc finger protein 385B n=1 Tax=Lygus hesperus TaxID=30085 RepID=A0A146KZB2_LYGHE
MYSSGYSVQTPESGRNPRGKKRKKLDSAGEEILCSVCDIWVMGVPQYQAHVKGSKHQRRTKERSADEVINRMPFMKWDKGTGIHTCEVCDVKLNSSLVVMVHVSGSRHKDNVEAYEAAHGEILTYGKPDDHKISSNTSTSDNIPLSSSGYSFNSTNLSKNGTSSKNEDHERKILEQVAKKINAH